MSLSLGPACASWTSFSVLEPEGAPHPQLSCCLGSSSPFSPCTSCPCPFACIACWRVGLALLLSRHVFPHIGALLRYVCAGLHLPRAFSPLGIASSKPCVVGAGPLQLPWCECLVAGQDFVCFTQCSMWFCARQYFHLLSGCLIPQLF